MSRFNLIWTRYFLSFFILALTISILIFGFQLTAQSDTADPESERILKKIASVRQAAKEIQIDGKSEDWENIPITETYYNQAIEGARNIVGLSLAPLEDRLRILIKTRDKPSKIPWSYFINLNTTKETQHDFQIGFHSDGQNVRVFSPYIDTFRSKLPGLKLAIGDVVEIEIPYASLENLIKPNLKPEYLQDKRNTFVRITAFTFDNAKNAGIDPGIAYASYCLIDGISSLDDELPKPLESPLLISVPVKDKWFVSNGSWQGTHEWEYDLTIRDVRWTSTSVKDSKDNADYFAWDTRIYSPIKGVVTRTVTNTEDGIPGDKTSSKGTNNGVWIQSTEGIHVYLVHMKKDSVSVTKGQRIDVNTEIGRTGSSGRSTEPHIHLGAGKLHSIRFQNVRVGINGGDVDPWERELDAWDIRRGYFFLGK